MKKQSIMAIACCCLMAVAVRAGISGPGWNTADEGAVHAEWTDWTQFNSGFVYGPDVWSAYDLSGNENDPAQGVADVLGGDNTAKIDGTGDYGIEISSNWDFSLWLPTYSGQDVLEVYLQVTYWDLPESPDWRQGWDFGVETVGEGAAIQGIHKVEESHDTDAGLITEAYLLAVTESPEGVFVDFNTDPPMDSGVPDPENGGGAAWVNSIQVDGLSHNPIPEPSVLVSLLLAGAGLLRRRPRR